jgi:hypothetical protein
MGIEDDPENQGQILSLKEGGAFKDEIKTYVRIRTLNVRNIVLSNCPINFKRLGCHPDVNLQ